MNQQRIPWGKISIDQEDFLLNLPCRQSLKIERKDDEVLITRERTDISNSFRYITGKELDVFLEPGLPDLPMTLKPQNPLSILPGKKMEAIIEVPLVIKILYGSKIKKNLLIEIPIDELSRSFFGNPDSGEISYFLESQLFKSIDSYTKQDRSIYCPVTIINKSTQNLEFERMILRVPYLSIYFGQDSLFSSPVEIIFRGQDQISQIIYKKYSPKDKVLELASTPRQVQDRSLLKKSFYFIKTLYMG